MKNDFFLSTHSTFIIREMRIRAYSQVLQSYKCVTLEALATAFGVSVEFIDKYEIFCVILIGNYSIGFPLAASAAPSIRSLELSRIPEKKHSGMTST